MQEQGLCWEEQVQQISALQSPKWSTACWNMQPVGLELLFLDDRELAQARHIPQGTGKVPRSHSLGRILLNVVKRRDWEGGWAHTRLSASERRTRWSGEPGNVGFSEPLHLSRVCWLFNPLKRRFHLVFCKLGQQTHNYSVSKAWQMLCCPVHSTLLLLQRKQIQVAFPGNIPHHYLVNI